MPFYNKTNRKDVNQQDLFDSTPSYSQDVKEFFETWNSYIWLPKLRCSDLQAHAIREAMMRPFFKNHWRESFSIMSKSSWIRTKMRPKFSLGWFLVNDNFDKIVDGNYLDETNSNSEIGTHKAIWNGLDEEII